MRVSVETLSLREALAIAHEREELEANGLWDSIEEEEEEDETEEGAR